MPHPSPRRGVRLPRITLGLRSHPADLLRLIAEPAPSAPLRATLISTERDLLNRLVAQAVESDGSSYHFGRTHPQLTRNLALLRKWVWARIGIYVSDMGNQLGGWVPQMQLVSWRLHYKRTVGVGT